MEPLEGDWLTKLRKLVFAELHKVVRRGTRLKDENSPEVVRLTYVLDIIRWKKQAGPRPDLNEQLADLVQRRSSMSSILSLRELERGGMFAWDYWARYGVWPESRQGYATLSSQTRWSLLEVANRRKKRRQLAKLLKKWHRAHKGLLLKDQHDAGKLQKQIDRLEVELARLDLEARELTKYDDRRLALQAAQPILNKRKVKGWHDFAVELRTIFHAELPEQFDEAAHQFIAEIVPYITGEHPIAGTIKKYLSRT